MDKKIFISYNWDDIEKINYIDSIFSRFQINLTRDIRDLKYNTNIHLFMDSIKDHDKLIIYISDMYLKSINCMYEASQILDKDDKVVFIIKKGIKIFSIQDKERLVKYWEEEYTRVKQLDSNLYQQEINDTYVVSKAIAPIIDMIKKCNRMDDGSLDIESLFKFLDIEKPFPNIINKTVYDWITDYSINDMGTVELFINDLKKSKYIELSSYPDIPLEEKSYIFHTVSFENDTNGMNLKIIYSTKQNGKLITINYPHLVQIEVNNIRSNSYSKYYFYCENLQRKRKYKELKSIKKYRKLDDEESKEFCNGYIDVYRIIIHF